MIQRQHSYDNNPTVYLIPTPIGNMEDITIRALNTLKDVDILFCEDTRETGKLLKYFDINKPMFSSHEYNEDKNIQKFLNLLKDGKKIGIVSDRGTPIISDPGYTLAHAAIESGYNVVSLPGPTALIPALTSSGISPIPFYFKGFLNSKGSIRKKELENLKNIEATLIIYEAPHRIQKTLEDIKNILGNNRYLSISREITKKYEEIIRGKIDEISLQNIDFKGELVLVIEGNHIRNDYGNITVKEHIDLYIQDGMLPMEAIKLVAKERGLKKSIVYNEYLAGDDER